MGLRRTTLDRSLVREADSEYQGSGNWPRWASHAVRLRSDLTVLVLDLILVSAAYSFMLALRYDGRVPSEAWVSFRTFAPMALLVTIAVNVTIGLYGHVWRHASFYEAQRMALSGGLSTTIVAIMTFLVIASSIKEGSRSSAGARNDSPGTKSTTNSGAGLNWFQ